MGSNPAAPTIPSLIGFGISLNLWNENVSLLNLVGYFGIVCEFQKFINLTFDK